MQFSVYFFIVMIFGISISARADLCGSTVDEHTGIDLRAPGKSMEEIPVLEQGGFGGCYGYAGAVLEMAYIRSKTPGLTPAEKDQLLTSPFVASLVAMHSSCNSRLGKMG